MTTRDPERGLREDFLAEGAERATVAYFSRRNGWKRDVIPPPWEAAGEEP
ncbi:MAG: hypothetical protein ACKN9U_09110 [Pirellulaceae bacterium]